MSTDNDRDANAPHQREGAKAEQPAQAEAGDRASTDIQARARAELAYFAVRNRVTTVVGDECVMYTGARDRCGYGRIRVAGRQRTAHSVAFEAAFGPVPAGLVIDHICRNRACVNPAHLRAVTQRENLESGDTIIAGLRERTHCRAGHAFTPENTIMRRDRGRRCRECERKREQGRTAVLAEGTP